MPVFIFSRKPAFGNPTRVDDAIEKRAGPGDSHNLEEVVIPVQTVSASHKYGRIASMRTTVDIPDPLYRELKSKAAREKRSVKELILRGVEIELRPRSKKRSRRVTFPLVPSRNPGTLVIDNAKIYEFISFP